MPDSRNCTFLFQVITLPSYFFHPLRAYNFFFFQHHTVISILQICSSYKKEGSFKLMEKSVLQLETLSNSIHSLYVLSWSWYRLFLNYLVLLEIPSIPTVFRYQTSKVGPSHRKSVAQQGNLESWFLHQDSILRFSDVARRLGNKYFITENLCNIYLPKYLQQT